MHQNKRWVPYESATPNFERKTWEIKNVLLAALIFKKSWSLWTKAWLASSLLEQKLIPSNWPIIFVQTPTTTQPKETGGQTWSKASTQSEGELHRRMEPVFVLLKKKKKLLLPDHACKNFLIFFQPIPIFVGNLAQNSTRFSLSNEPFLLIKHVFSFFVFMQITYWAHLCTYKPSHQESFGVFPFFPKQQAWPHVFIRIFGKSKFSTKTEIILVFVRNKWVLKIQVIP